MIGSIHPDRVLMGAQELAKELAEIDPLGASSAIFKALCVKELG